MLNDHWVVALLIGDTISVVLIISAAILGVIIARRWDITSSSEFQLILERRSYLVSTIVVYVFLFEMLSLWLFVVTVNNHLPPLIKGAMCGTGSLNANEYGWGALLMKIIVFILLSLWLTIHYLDRKAPEYPLTKEKFIFLIPIAPLILITYVVQILYFLNINPNIITTCCSLTFGSTSNGTTISVFSTSVDGYFAVQIFYLFVVLNITASIFSLSKMGWLKNIGIVSAPFVGVIFSMVSIYAIIHHYVKYIYGLPSHRCPFDMLWSQYYFIGYLIYGLIFLLTISSFLIGMSLLIESKSIILKSGASFKNRAAIVNVIATLLLFVLLSIFEHSW